ncbi:uncharacterized protein [Dysidea avara]|uniref:uncharacterized protein isoform X3 n=1 Tax=Dysidea avara TaxID=196820 RepID=UPI00331E5C7A
MCAAKSDGTKRTSDEGSEAVISYIRSHHNPAVELFAASLMEDWMNSPEKIKEMSELCVKSLQQSDDNSITCLIYLHHVIHHTPNDIIDKEHYKWSSCLIQAIKSCDHSRNVEYSYHSYQVLKSFLDVIVKCPEASRHFSTNQLPSLIQVLLSFRNTAPPQVTRYILNCVSVCLHYYPSLASQHYTSLSVWAFEGLVSPSPAVSRESSRVLALLGYDVTSWEKIVHKLCGELNYLINVAYAPFTKPGDRSVQFTSSLPSLPTSEPERIATISQYYQVIVRTLIYLLSFRCDGSVKVPLHLLMTVICQPFSLVPDKLEGRHSLELLLVKSSLPLFYSTVFILLAVLIKCVGPHLIPYSTLISQLFTHTLMWTSSSYQQLRCVVYHCLANWLSICKCHTSHDHIVGVVIADTNITNQVSSYGDVVTGPKRKKRRQVNKMVDISNSTQTRPIMDRMLQYCSPLMTSYQLEGLEQHLIKMTSCDALHSVVMVMVLQCVARLMTSSCHKYTPPVSWATAVISKACHSSDEQVRATALQLMYQHDVTNHFPSPQLVPSTDVLSQNPCKDLWDHGKSTVDQHKSNEYKSTNYQDKLLWDQDKTTEHQDKLLWDQNNSTDRDKSIEVQDKSTEVQDNQEEIIMIDANSSNDEGDTINDVTKDLMLSCDTEEDVTAEVVLKKFVEDSDMSSDEQ